MFHLCRDQVVDFISKMFEIHLWKSDILSKDVISVKFYRFQEGRHQDRNETSKIHKLLLRLFFLQFIKIMLFHIMLESI